MIESDAQKLARFTKALENLAQINNSVDADAAADYAQDVLDGADPDKFEDGSMRPWWIRSAS